MIISPSMQNHAAFSIKHQSFLGGTYWLRSLYFQRQSKRRGCSAIVASVEPPAKALRLILESPGIHQGPACFDALSAKLVERAGFEFCFTSGFSVSAARLGLPDVGLISYGEMVDQGNQITQAVSIPVIGDGDTGYGNPMNVKRTVKGYIKAGFAGIILEDQMAPKACGHTCGRKVVSREESVMRIKAAVDARKESGSDIIIIARTDSRQALTFEESLWRSQAFGDAGADVLFIDALASIEEMKAFCEIAPLIPKMANMLEGGGKTPILSPIELEELGFKIVAYPLSLIGSSIRAMEDALIAIKGGRIPPPSRLPSFEEVREIIGFNDYYEEEKHYTIREDSSPALQRGYSSQGSEFIETSKIENKADQGSMGQTDSVFVSVSSYLNDDNSSDGSNISLSRILSTTLRIKITGRDGMEKLDVRIPGGFLDRISNIIPELVGVNIKEKLEETTKKFVNAQKGVPFLDFKDAMGDRVQVFIE